MKKRLFLLPFLVALMGADNCTTIDKRAVAARSLGPDAICTWKDGSQSNWEVICITRGRRYTCLVEDERVGCAATSDATPAEAK